MSEEQGSPQHSWRESATQVIRAMAELSKDKEETLDNTRAAWYFLSTISEASWVRDREDLILGDLVGALYSGVKGDCPEGFLSLGYELQAGLSRLEETIVKSSGAESKGLPSNVRSFLHAYGENLLPFMIPEALDPTVQPELSENMTVKSWGVIAWLSDILRDEPKSSAVGYNLSEELLVSFGQYGLAENVDIILNSPKLDDRFTRWLSEGANRRGAGPVSAYRTARASQAKFAVRLTTKPPTTEGTRRHALMTFIKLFGQAPNKDRKDTLDSLVKETAKTSAGQRWLKQNYPGLLPKTATEPKPA